MGAQMMVPLLERKKLQAEIFSPDSHSSLGTVVSEDFDRLIIGSSKKADLVLPHGSVSHIHAMLRVLDDDQIVVYDLGSEHGTFVDGKRIIERKLRPGEEFEIAGHRVRVALLNCEDLDNEQAGFLSAKNEENADRLQFLFLENGMVREETVLMAQQKLIQGKNLLGVPWPGQKKGAVVVQRKGQGSQKTASISLPEEYSIELFSGKSEKLAAPEGKTLVLNHNQKVRLVSPDGQQQILFYWTIQGKSVAKSHRDEDQAQINKIFAACSAMAAAVLLLASLSGPEKTVPEEALVPKTSYYRLSMDSAPAGAQREASNEAAQGVKESASAPTKAESIASSLSQILNKQSSLDAKQISQAVGRVGDASTRLAPVKSGALKTGEIAGGLSGGVNVGALSAGLASGGGGTGKGVGMGGFAKGKGTGIGIGAGFGGKGFDMSLGGEEAEAIGGLDKALIAAVVQSNIGQIKHCYERQLIVDPNIFGKVVAQWTINKEGVVSASSVKSSTMKNSAVENCIVSKIKGWNFPKPKGGGQVLVSYPFLFKSLN
jgi:pSer/pThr/pTyr-binding forkhead associated (FHA) protein